MKVRAILLALLMLCGLGVVRAQDSEPEYRLIKPVINRFVETVPNAIQHWSAELPAYYVKVPSIPIGDIVNYEITNDYSYEVLFQQNFETLSKLYDALKSVVPVYSLNNSTDNQWYLPLLKAWLRDNPADLDNQTKLDIPGFGITVQPVDFDGDGINEYVLHMGFGYITEFLVLKKNSTLKEGYDISEFMWNDDSQPLNSHFIDAGTIDDFNVDGLPEWVMYDELHGYYDWCKDFEVVGWQNGSIRNLIADQPKTDCMSGDVEFINLDQDAAKEIRQINRNSGDGENWGCTATTTVIWDWDGTDYHVTQEKTDQATTLGCAMKEAESLVWDGEIEKAVPIYERGIQQHEAPDGTPADEMLQYAKARLAVAYALVGRYEDAGHLIAELKSETPQSEMMSVLIKQLSNSPVTDISLCAATFNVFWEYKHSMFGYGLPSNIVVGRNHFVCCVGDNSPPEPEKAGCNAPRLIDQTLSKKRFLTNQSPVDQMTALDIGVETSSHADLNGDRREEWLIWPIAKVAPILFVPDKDAYIISRPNVRRPNQYSQLESYPLPQREGTSLVDWIYLDHHPTNVEAYYYDINNVGSYSCSDTEHDIYGSALLWQLKGTELKQILDIPLCEQREISALFQNENQEIHAWSLRSTYDHWANFAPTIFRWETLSHSYKPPMQITLTSTNNAHEDTTVLPASLSEADLFNEMSTITDEMWHKQYTEALERIDNALAHHVPNVLPLLTNGLQYYRGITLEALNRPDEALVEYVTIYQNAPESAWGKLAALHLECVANCAKETPTNK
jgi:hypothetical protein